MVIADAMVEISVLPCNPVLAGVIVFPFADHARHPLRRRESNQRMQVVRHQEKEMTPPSPAIVVEIDRFEQGQTQYRIGQGNAARLQTVAADTDMK
jgi:predicted ATPase